MSGIVHLRPATQAGQTRTWVTDQALLNARLDAALRLDAVRQPPRGPDGRYQPFPPTPPAPPATTRIVHRQASAEWTDSARGPQGGIVVRQVPPA